MSYYVYHLIDPRTQAVFYVGKGKGNRIAMHEREAERGVGSRKCERIREIWASGHSVARTQVRSFADEAEAYRFEAEEIARLGLDTLTNMAPGGGGSRGAEKVASVTECRHHIGIAVRFFNMVASGRRLSAPWHEPAEAAVRTVLGSILKRRGRAFLARELAKLGVELA